MAQKDVRKLLHADARTVLSRVLLPSPYRTGAPNIMLTADQMRSLPEFFADIPDPRRHLLTGLPKRVNMVISAR